MAGLRLTTLGNGIELREDPAPSATAKGRLGTAVLVGGAIVVLNTSITALTRIILTSQVDGGTPGFLRVSARTPGTSFTITSSAGADTSTVAFLLVEPS